MAYKRGVDEKSTASAAWSERASAAVGGTVTLRRP